MWIASLACCVSDWVTKLSPHLRCLRWFSAPAERETSGCRTNLLHVDQGSRICQERETRDNRHSCRPKIYEVKKKLNRTQTLQDVEQLNFTSYTDYLAFAEGGPRLKIQTVFFIILGGRDGNWLYLSMWPFRDILGRLTRSTAHCHHRREQNVFVCAFIASVALCHNFEPLVSHMNVHAGCGRSWRTFLERFWLRWFSPLCTYWGQVYWHNASLVLNWMTNKDMTLNNALRLQQHLPEYHHQKIEPIPWVPQIRKLVHEKALAYNLQNHLHGVDSCKYVSETEEQSGRQQDLMSAALNVVFSPGSCSFPYPV